MDSTVVHAYGTTVISHRRYHEGYGPTLLALIDSTTQAMALRERAAFRVHLVDDGIKRVCGESLVQPPHVSHLPVRIGAI